MIFCAEPQAATDSVQISAAPPCCSISALVCSAGLADPPSPDREAPISATITRAPAPAIMIAISRPTPPPAPVTTTTLPSIMPTLPVAITRRSPSRGTDPAAECRPPLSGGMPPAYGMQNAARRSERRAMLGLNHEFPLLLPTVLEHGAMNFGATEIVSHGREEALRTDYARTASRARRLASSLRRMGFGADSFAGSLA